MAGRPRKNNVSMEEMIKHQEDAVEKAKSKYDSEVAKLKDLLAKKDEIRRKEILKAVESSGKTFEEIIEFLKGRIRIMQEYSRIILEEYRRTHKSVRSRRIAELVELSYDVNSYASEADAIFLEKAISQERNEERREALIELEDFLFPF